MGVLEGQVAEEEPSFAEVHRELITKFHMVLRRWHKVEMNNTNLRTCLLAAIAEQIWERPGAALSVVCLLPN